MPIPVETTVLNEATYAVGDYSFLPVSIPVGYTVAYAKLSRALWLDPLTHVQWDISVSQDSGATWVPLASGTSVGGISIDPRTGIPRPFYTVGAGISQPDNPNRQLKGTIHITGGPITTTIYAGLY